MSSRTFLASLQTNPISIIAEILVYIGALNWLAIGLQNVDYVSRVAGQYTKYVFILVGIAGLYLVITKGMYYYKAQMEGMDGMIYAEEDVEGMRNTHHGDGHGHGDIPVKMHY